MPDFDSDFPATVDTFEFTNKEYLISFLSILITNRVAFKVFPRPFDTWRVRINQEYTSRVLDAADFERAWWVKEAKL